MVRADIKDIDYEEIKKTIFNINNPRDKALLCVIYSTGARIGEVEMIKKSDLKVQELNNNVCLVYNLFTEKRRATIYRLVPVRMDLEEWLIQPVLQFMNFGYGEKLFKIKQRQMRKIVHKYFGVHPHILRHSRATHLVRYYRFTDTTLTRVMGWKDAKMATRYVHQNVYDIANAFS